MMGAVTRECMSTTTSYKEHDQWKPPLIQTEPINDFGKVVFTENIVKTNRKSNEIFRKIDLVCWILL